MADEDQLRILRQGPEAWNAWRQTHRQVSIDLRSADLHGANLFGANLHGADLTEANFDSANLSFANLGEANLTGADLSGAKLDAARLDEATLTHANLSNATLMDACLDRADFSGATLHGVNLDGFDLGKTCFRQANLSGANLSGAELRKANFIEADLSEADLRAANLIDARLDRATLTRARLWETQRHGWSIRDLICRGAFWDRDGKELTDYKEGEFERLFSEKPRIVLHYAGGVSPIDLIALPVIVERLQAEHRDSVLQIRSVQNDAGGASVVITVEDLEDRGTEAFAVEFEKIRAELVSTQHRLQNETELRISFEAQCQVLVERVIPTLAAAPKQQINIGQLTAPTIEGIIMSKGDTYNVGQAGAVGPQAYAHDMSFQQIQGGLDLPKLAEELGHLREVMKRSATGTREQDKAIGAVADAEEAATRGDGSAVLRYLRNAGTWTLKVAEDFGAAVAVEALKQAIIPGP